MKAGKFYGGPVREINPTYGSPYSIDDHCPRCGCTELTLVRKGKEPNRKVAFTAETWNKIDFYRCERCGLEFRLPEYAGRSINGGAKFKLKGRFSDDEDRVYTRSEVKDAAYRSIMDHRDNHQVTESAGRFYEDFYYGKDEDGEDFDSEFASDLEGDLPWVEADDMSYRGYIDHMDVGDTYRFPDFDLEVVRVANRRPTKTAASKPKTATRCSSSRSKVSKTSSASKKPINPPKKPAKNTATRRK